MKIGIFDSGIGGMTVASAIKNSLPEASIIFFGDTAWFPYNDKTEKEILSRVLYACDILADQGCSVILLACNTASVVAYNTVKHRFAGKLKIVTIVDLTIKALVEWHHIKQNIGIIGTVHTINSEVYEKGIKNLDPNLHIKKLATPKLAALAEQYCSSKNCNLDLLYTYLKSPELDNIDTLLLACTHYSILRKEIETFYNGRVSVLDAIETTKNTIESYLQESQTSSPKEKQYLVFCSKLNQNFEQAVSLLLGENIDLREV